MATLELNLKAKPTVDETSYKAGTWFAGAGYIFLLAQVAKGVFQLITMPSGNRWDNITVHGHYIHGVPLNQLVESYHLNLVPIKMNIVQQD